MRIKSDPPGAEAKVASGTSCRTPCELTVQPGSDTSITLTLAGYQPHTVSLRSDGGESGNKLTPNPVYAELQKAAPVPAKKKVAAKKKPTTTAAVVPQNATAAVQTPPPAAAPAAEPPPSGGSSFPGRPAGNRSTCRRRATTPRPRASRSRVVTLDALADIRQSCHISRRKRRALVRVQQEQEASQDGVRFSLRLGAAPLDAPRRADALIDPFGRAITYLRVSVTDRCDFRCVYCMSENMTFLPKADLLTLEELDRAVQRLHRARRPASCGSPAASRWCGADVMTLFRSLSRHLQSGALEELTLTTNGSQLAKYAAELAGLGVKRINVSLDTLDADKFRAITRWGELDKVLAGVDAAQEAGLKVKINAVALKGVNEDEIPDLINWAHGRGMDLDLDRSDAARRCRRRPARSVSAALDGARASGGALHADRHRLPDRRAGALRPRRGDRRHARLHHAAHA